MGAVSVDVTYAQLDDAHTLALGQDYLLLHSKCSGCSIFIVVGFSRPKKATTHYWAGLPTPGQLSDRS